MIFSKNEWKVMCQKISGMFSVLFEEKKRKQNYLLKKKLID